MREDARVAGHLGREHLVGVQRVVVARRTRVLDDLGAREVVDDDRLVDVADGERVDGAAAGSRAHRPVGAHPDHARDDDELAVLAAVLGDGLAELQQPAAAPLLLPALALVASRR